MFTALFLLQEGVNHATLCWNCAKFPGFTAPIFAGCNLSPAVSGQEDTITTYFDMTVLNDMDDKGLHGGANTMLRWKRYEHPKKATYHESGNNLLNNKKMKKHYELAGMSCGGCVNNVRQTLLKVPGVTAAEVQLRPQGAVLTMDKTIGIDELQAQLKKAGHYTIKEIVSNLSA